MGITGLHCLFFYHSLQKYNIETKHIDRKGGCPQDDIHFVCFVVFFLSAKNNVNKWLDYFFIITCKLK